MQHVMNTENATKQTTPKLKCQVTGKQRITNQKYLAQKADKKGVPVDEFLSYYVSKDALRQLKAGASVEAIRAEATDAPTNVLDTDWVKKSIIMNGKNGPSGPHRPRPATSTETKTISPEIELLVKTVQEKEVSEA